MTATLRAVEDPATSPQDRGAVIDSAKALAAALEVISDDNTPGKLQDRLTALVKQTTATLDAGQEPGVGPEDRSRLFVVVKRTTAALDTIADPKAPEKQGKQLAAIVKDVNYALEQSNGAGEMGGTAIFVSSSLSFLITLNASSEQGGVSQGQSSASQEASQGVRGKYDEQQQQLADASEQVSRSMRRASDPKASSEDRADAQREVSERTTHMKDEQKESASDQDPPDAALGKAAEVCTNAIFGVVSDRKISNGLKGLTPSSWDSTGVKDFWKAKEEANDMLDVRAQLQNDEHAHGPFALARLIERLADVVPGNELTGTVGNAALHCTQTAFYLEEDGITVGTWLTSAGG
ncbi:hypothetical protein ACFQ6S_19210 [Streptomyces sp. NPDC056479]|uniref:hypothetical protein n=1 Tax=Streptomyces sp. NPDC056479 TaxID=3345832 RepID=UPI0036BC3F2F